MTADRRPRRGKAGIFFSGFFSGILFTALIGLGGMLYLLNNPPASALKVANAGVSRIVRKVTSSMPKDYMAKNQKEISDLLSGFVKAYSTGKITPADLDVLTQKGFEFSADQKITEEEIRQMLDLIRKYVQEDV